MICTTLKLYNISFGLDCHLVIEVLGAHTFGIGIGSSYVHQLEGASARLHEPK